MSKILPPQPLPTSIPNPIQVSIDKIAFDGIVFDDINSASAWPESVVSDQLVVHFTIKNNSQAPAPYSVVTGVVMDGNMPVMSSGDNSKNNFFQPDSMFVSIPSGGKVTGSVIMKWDGKWAAAPQAVGHCFLGLSYWAQSADYQPGDLTFFEKNPAHNPNAPKTDPDTGFPLPVVPKEKAVYFRITATGSGSIDISPSPCLAARLAANSDRDDTIPWENWTETFGFMAARVYRPKSAAEIAQAVLDAEAANVPLRAVGSGWSISDTALPLREQLDVQDAREAPPLVTLGPPHAVTPHKSVVSKNVYVIDTRFLASSLQDRLEEIADPEVVNHGFLINEVTPKYLFHVQAGITNADLHALLDHQSPPLALQTSGGSDGATIAGALSTSTHGGDWNGPPPADAVRAIHLVGPRGREYWIEPASKPITTPERVHATYPCIDRDHVIYDDTLFYTVLVSMGCMGVIYLLVLEAVPQYGVREATVKTEWLRLKMDAGGSLAPLTHDQATNLFANLKAGNGILPKDSNYFVKVSFNPWPNGNDEGNFDCWVTNRAKVAVPLPRDSSNGSGGLSSLNLAVLEPSIENAIPGGFGDLQKANIKFSILGPFLNSLQRADGSMPPMSDTALLILKFAKERGYDWLPRAANKAVLDLLQRAADSSGKPTPNGQPQPDGVPQVLLNVSYKIGGGVWGGGDPLPGRAIEVALPCPDGLVFLDEKVLPLFRALGKNGQYVLGYISVRICGKTRALFGMQQWDPTCHVEVVLLDSEDAPSIITSIQQLALNYNPPGLLHWGLENDLRDVFAQGKPQPFVSNGAYEAWKEARSRLGHPPFSLFNNNFSRRMGLSVP